jgi:hypothetical protein
MYSTHNQSQPSNKINEYSRILTGGNYNTFQHENRTKCSLLHLEHNDLEIIVEQLSHLTLFHFFSPSSLSEPKGKDPILALK